VTIRIPFARLASPLLALAGLLALASPAGAGLAILPDSTVLDVWRLGNGLGVVVRHISTCQHVAMTLAWPTGSDGDPQGQAGRAALLAQLELTSSAGDIPERTRAEMSTIRPSGWSLSAGPTVTQLTEIADLQQFPGALHQMAQRLRGVTLTDSVLRHALGELSSELRATHGPTSNAELYAGVRDVAHLRYDPAAGEAGLKALSKLPLAAMQARMDSTFGPEGAVLSLAGNLGDMNLHALIENEFGGIPSRHRPSPLPVPGLTAGFRQATRAGLDHNAGCLGILAPAIDDSLHPSFYFSMLVLGTQSSRAWGKTEPPLSSRFQYSLFDDPEMARFYPPIANGAVEPATLFKSFRDAAEALENSIITPDVETPMIRGVIWLLGGAMSPELLARAARDPSVLGTLSTNQAVRELWGGEAFWSRYRARFMAHQRPFRGWMDYLFDSSHRVGLVLTPRR
jgi:hypothetical protein